MIINRIYETKNLLSLELVSFLVGLRTYQHPCIARGFITAPTIARYGFLSSTHHPHIFCSPVLPLRLRLYFASELFHSCVRTQTMQLTPDVRILSYLLVYRRLTLLLLAFECRQVVVWRVMETLTRPAHAKYLAFERGKLAMASSDKQTKEQSGRAVFSKALLSWTVLPPAIRPII